ncbi:retinol-binding protein pinta-like [Danaus plexippus]|uniref:retinol-binding protein pinta-like n=1 Tax=Danaus plexippus TaxID=13037 RepID=UPI002AB26E39|nr:retinol-binding protein pinta-like [Danaus plexippus]
MFRPLRPALQEKAIREVFEKPDRITSDIKTLREWLEKQPHLQAVNPSDQWLLSFLRGNKFSLEKTKEKLDMYYALKNIVPEIFKYRDPFDPKIQEILKLGPYLPLTSLTSDDGQRFCVTRFGLHDPNKIHIFDILKVIIMIIEILMFEDDNFIISGESLFIDLKDVSLITFSQWTPNVAKKILVCVEKALPVRMKSCHLLNIPPGFDTAFAIFRAFVSEKLKNRVHVYKKNYEEIFNTIPKNILPKELDGETGTLQEIADYWKAKVESYRDWFLNEEECSDESLRPGKPRSSSSIFGVEGSFRQLDVD